MNVYNQKMIKSSRFLSFVAVAALTVMLGTAVLPARAGYVVNGVKKGARATSNGVKKGCDVTVGGVKKGVDVTVGGTKKGLRSTGNFFKKVF